MILVFGNCYREGMDLSIRYPAEWEPHRAVWLAWPSHGELWGKALPEVQREFVQLCRAIADIDPDTGEFQGEALWILVPDEAREAEARDALAGLGASFFRGRFGDIWLRDTGPLFLKQGDQLLAARFLFNGWGGKFMLEHDDQVSEVIARFTEPARTLSHPWILEGGSIEMDGKGNLLTTEECLLNPNRNSTMNRERIEARLRSDLGIQNILWLERGLSGDHTDGHIDNIARFGEKGKIICMEPQGVEDPNRDVLRKIEHDLRQWIHLQEDHWEVVKIPSAGRVLDVEGNLMAASHVNFYVGNRTVVVPFYPHSPENELLSILGECFPDRQVRGCPAWHLLHGGGSFHCITQQVPA